VVPNVEGSNPFYRPSLTPRVPLTYLQAIILGIVQGLTEFFPVSSSGHLELLQVFFGLQNIKHIVFFDLVCHLGTLGALCLVFLKDIQKVFKDKKLILALMIAITPLFPLLLILKEIKSLFEAPFLLGFTFLITSLLLFLSVKNPVKSPKKGLASPLFIGLFQAIAILPGISRSGSTIAAARLIGWGVDEAIRFSFLLAIPTILGGVFIESLNVLKEGSLSSANAVHYTLGFTFSFAVGFFALKMLMRLGIKALTFFAWYCLALSLFCLIYFF
jgi:undecaprenyl-diphosphatase